MAVKSLGQLTVDLIAKTGGFTQGMTAAERQSAKTAAKIKRQQQQLARELDSIFRGIGLAAAAAFAAVGISVKKSTDDMLKLGIAAKQVAMPVDEFSALVAVAKNADVSMESLSTALRAMAKNLALAKQGSAQAANAFKALGLDPNKLKDSKTAFLAIADALSKYRDDVNKTAIEQQIFSRSGAELNGLLDLGEAGIKRLMERQRELGNVVTPAAEQATADYDAVVKRLNDRFTGLRNTLAVALLPTMTEAAEKMDGFIGGMDSRSVDDFAGSIRALAHAFEFVAKNVTAGYRAVQAFGRWVAFKKTGIIDTDAPLRDQESQFNALMTKRETLQNRYNATGNKFVKSQLDEVTEQIRRAQDAFKAMQQLQHPAGAEGAYHLTGKDVPDWMKAGLGAQPPTEAPRLNLLSTTSKTAKAPKDNSDRNRDRTLDDLAQQMKEMDSLTARYASSINGVTSAEQAFNDRMTDANKLLEAGAINFDQYTRIATDGLDQLNGKAQPTFDAMTEYATQAARNIQDAFAQFLFEPMEGGFKGLLQSFGEMLRKMAAQMAASAVLQALGSSMQGSQYGWVAAIGNALAGQRAAGGPVDAKRTYLVGERGPELFTPNGSGHITPNNQLGSMGRGGAGGFVYNAGDVTVNNGDGEPDPNAARQLGKMIEAKTKEIIVRATQPGGLLWKQRNGVMA